MYGWKSSSPENLAWSITVWLIVLHTTFYWARLMEYTAFYHPCVVDPNTLAKQDAMVPHPVYSASRVHKEEEVYYAPPLTHTFLTLNGKKQQHSDSPSTLHTTWQIYPTCIYVVEHTGSLQKNQKVLSLQQHRFIIVAFPPWWSIPAIRGLYIALVQWHMLR